MSISDRGLTVCVVLNVDHCFGDYKMLKAKHLLFLSCLFLFFFYQLDEQRRSIKHTV